MTCFLAIFSIFLDGLTHQGTTVVHIGGGSHADIDDAGLMVIVGILEDALYSVTSVVVQTALVSAGENDVGLGSNPLHGITQLAADSCGCRMCAVRLFIIIGCEALNFRIGIIYFCSIQERVIL